MLIKCNFCYVTFRKYKFRDQNNVYKVEIRIHKENIEKMKLNPAISFCESYLGNSQELEGACNQLTESNCAQTPCCVYEDSSNSKCVAGGIHGPTYKTDKDGKLITMDSYYYLGVRH